MYSSFLPPFLNRTRECRFHPSRKKTPSTYQGRSVGLGMTLEGVERRWFAHAWHGAVRACAQSAPQPDGMIHLAKLTTRHMVSSLLTLSLVSFITVGSPALTSICS
ncbi:hypothetical protein P280DRAFT_240312 [Massarina eburnea CBS 473.64]|uniref:Uncharacterized protein n=1 Tax=Massarina eburnea CBS 473.64 TaxID=1395130 RepID=A0A6A6S9N7_9PLEO|nr:hypothetical protein P280DRAFT_240312 [Massarina eburnea CBS 473.64]